ncbi:MAG: hypothetical protein PHC46_02370 [Clostridia bacterium]|nr:hypothetical protein [Clostridia bacterium]
MKYKIITDDTFDIAKRLKAIDNNYIIKWNILKKRYEVFYDEGDKQVLQIVLPYSELDTRTLNIVNKTRVENYKALIAEIEQKNQKLTQEAEKQLKDNANYQMKEMTKYILKKGDNYNIDFSDSYKTKWF